MLRYLLLAQRCVVSHGRRPEAHAIVLPALPGLTVTHAMVLLPAVCQVVADAVSSGWQRQLTQA